MFASFLLTVSFLLPVLPLLPAAPTDPAPGSEQDGVLFTVASAALGDRFGTSIASAGDIDQDGIADLLVGVPGADVMGTNSGEILVFSGNGGAALLALTGDSEYDRLGWAVDGVGDIDGDGVPDLLAGLPTGTPGSGSVNLYSGVQGALLLTIPGTNTGDRFGHAVAGIGDIDGDGVPDLVVGAPQADVDGTNAGRATVHSGATGAVLWTLDGASFDHLGQSVSDAGDVDHDGIPDVLIGAPLCDLETFNGGSLWVLSGGHGGILGSYHGTGVGDQVGQCVANAGDVDGDGTLDQVIGAPGVDAGAIDTGAALVRSGFSGALLHVIPGEAEGELLHAVDGAGDVDGDGVPDLVIGASAAGGIGTQAGRVRIISGASGLTLRSVDGKRPFDWFGASVAGAGDLNGDGHPDVIAGAPGHDDVLTTTGKLSAIAGLDALQPVARPPLKDL